MKKLTGIGLALIGLALVFSPILAFLFQRHLWMTDAEVCRRITGTWLISPWSQNGDASSTTTFYSNHTYAAQVSNATNGWVLTVEGKWQVNWGKLTQTVTKASQTNVSPGTFRIIRLNDRELVTAWEGDSYLFPATEVVARKIAP